MKIVAIGGGTGLSSLLRGLKKYDIDLTAVVAVTDEGGSSGRIREELGVPPPGDVRNNIVALAKEDLLGKLFSYRFSSVGDLSGHTVGNIIMAALTRMTGSFGKAVEYISKILAIKGQVLPVCEEMIRLVATYSDGMNVVGERKITSYGKKISSVKLNKRAKALDQVVLAIESADAIIIGPGSLYTSIISNLLVEGVVESITHNYKAVKIYVANIMTQPGETQGYSLKDHVDEIKKYVASRIDCVFVNTKVPDKSVLDIYLEEGSELIEPSCDGLGEDVVKKPFATVVREEPDFKPKIRHVPDILALEIMRYVQEKKGLM